MPKDVNFQCWMTAEEGEIMTKAFAHYIIRRGVYDEKTGKRRTQGEWLKGILLRAAHSEIKRSVQKNAG